MITIEHIEVWGFEHAIRGMRNPMNSWDKSDSYPFNLFFDEDDFNDAKKDGYIGKDCVYDQNMHGGEMKCPFTVGANDLDLMHRLFVAGHPHRKYLRQIMVSMDITAPLYWWKEFDTYKVGTTANSCSTMHKIHTKEFSIDDFSCEHLSNGSRSVLEYLIVQLEACRTLYLETKDKSHWWQMIQLLPTSYNQKRTVTMNYENIFNMLQYREGHKLDEWNQFCATLKNLPYIKDIMKGETDGSET